LLVALVAVVAGLSPLTAPSASAAPLFSSSFVTQVGGSQNGFSLAGPIRFTLATFPGDPSRPVSCRNFTPGEPCRVLTTVATVTGTDAGGNTCRVAGTSVQAVSVDATALTYTVPANPIVPGNPIIPGDPCRTLGTVSVRVSLSIAGGIVTGASATAGSVDLPADLPPAL